MSAADDRAALRAFERLLGKRSSEQEFQQLFGVYPTILSKSLPLRLQPSNIRPLGRPGRSEPDFLIAPDGQRLSNYGVIELKRPDQRILSLSARKGLIVLSRTAATAVAQTQLYLSQVDRSRSDSPSDAAPSLVVGNPSYAFVIMGLSSELANAAASDLFQAQLAGLLPPNCQIVPYDVLCSWFRTEVGPEMFVLVPARPPAQVTLPEIDDVLYDPNYWRVSDVALEYWSELTDIGSRGDSRAKMAFGIDPERWTIQSGPLAGTLDTVTEANESLAMRAIAVLRALQSQLPPDVRRPVLDVFLEGVDLILASGHHAPGGSHRELTELEVAVLSLVVSWLEDERRAGSPTDLIDFRTSTIAALTDHGLLRFERMGSETMRIAVHPVLQWFGPVRWDPSRARPLVIADIPGRLLGSAPSSTLDDELGTVAVFGFESPRSAEGFRRWLSVEQGLGAALDESRLTVTLFGYDEVDQFDRLSIRQVATQTFDGERLE